MAFFEENITRDKLLVLYLLCETGFELTAEQILRAALDNAWDDYFSLRHSLVELGEAALVAPVTRPSGVHYAATEAGRAVLLQFSARIPFSQRQSVAEYIARHKRRLLQEVRHHASCTPAPGGDFSVTLAMDEGEQSVFSVSILVSSREAANTLVNRWEERAGDVYKSVFDVLTH